MKKLRQILSYVTVLVFVLHFSLSAVFGQAPHFMSYQAVVRNASNALVVNAPVGIKVSILQTTPDGAVVFEETHVVNTNGFGLATLEIGNGTVVSGSIATILWTAGPYFIKTETDPNGGADYSITSVTQLMSVPYALFAETSGSSTPGPQGEIGPQGPQGEPGPVGPQGPAGEGGMSVNCLECHNHNPATASPLAKALANAGNEIQYSKHAEGSELAISEGGSAGCAPCHSNEGFHSVVDGNVIPTYILGGNGKYSFSYNATAAASSGLTTLPTTMGCFTCHKGNAADSMALYTTAAVPMTMWSFPGQTKTIDLTQNGGESNLCVKCHQPRPMSYSTTLSNGASVNYADLAANPGNMFFDIAVGNAAPNKLVPSYRTHNHYGAIGAVFAGKGGVEFAGALSYDNTSTHPTAASCQDCHMATPTAMTGGHTFWMTNPETGTTNFKGCNKAGCHTTMSATNTSWVNTRAEIQGKLEELAQKLITPDGIEIMHKNPDVASNVFAEVTPEGYDGYLDIFDPSTNPTGAIRNPAPSNSWSAADKATNLALPSLGSLLNVQFGAIINFQLCLREYSKGVHNPAYSRALLYNSIDALTAQGF
ncbi:MAG: collagen-like protein [Bacteroidetes bacterium]|nr:collagen-like protein [Bacteroidota bacterium]